jgi:hypothetical protein
MTNVSPIDTGTKVETFVDRLSIRKRSTWNYHGFLTSEEGL